MPDSWNTNDGLDAMPDYRLDNDVLLAMVASCECCGQNEPTHIVRFLDGKRFAVCADCTQEGE